MQALARDQVRRYSEGHASTNMQALARDQVRRYSEGHGFGKASGPHTI